MIKNNILANLVGGSWNTLLVIFITPVYVSILGLEAYGLISFVAVLQIVVGAFDFGLSATVTREVARDGGAERNHTVALINSAGTVYWAMTLVVACCLWLSAEFVASRWLKANTLPQETLIVAMQLTAAYLALRWPVAFYAGILSGLQQMGTLNGLKSSAISLRFLGGAVLLYFQPDVISLLNWYILTAAIELVSCAAFAFNSFPALCFKPCFHFSAVRSAWRFSASMYAITLLAMLLTQLDRFAIGNLLGLEALGYYAVAYTLAMGISFPQTAINNAALPAFANVYGNGDVEVLDRRYEKVSQLMGFVVTAPAIALVVFGQDVLQVWVGEDVAEGAYQVLGVLSIGFLLNAVYSNCFILSIAAGRPMMFLWANLIGLGLYLPALVIGIRYGGILGAASAWAFLNIFYVTAVLPKAHGALGARSTLLWLQDTLGIFLGIGVIAFGVGWSIAQAITGTVGSVLGLLIALGIYLWLSLNKMFPDLKNAILGIPQGLWWQIEGREKR